MLDLNYNINFKNRPPLSKHHSSELYNNVEESAMVKTYRLIIVQAISLILLIIVIIFKTISSLTHFQILIKLSNIKMIFLIPFTISLIFTGIIPIVLGEGSYYGILWN